MRNYVHETGSRVTAHYTTSCSMHVIMRVMKGGEKSKNPHHNLFGKDTILCGITCPIIKSLFHEHKLKYVEVVEDCTVTSDLRGKRKLHLGIQTLITARSLEGTIINYIYSCSP